MQRSPESNDALHAGRKLSRGFSLFEMLVVLVIIGLVSALAMTMLSQLRRVLDRFYPAAEHYARLEVRVSMLSSIIASLVPSRTPTTEFKGERAALTGLATYFPAGLWPDEHLIRLSITTSDGASVLKAERLAGDGRVQTTFELLRLSCTRAQFWYLDGDMRWREQWTQQRQFPYLPLAVHFSCASDRQPLDVIAAIEREGASIITDMHMMQLNR